MDTRRLAYFIKVVESSSITAAARELGVAQPALSQQLRVLEHEMKATLLVRSRTGALPTAAGLKLYNRAKHIIRDISSLELELRGGQRSGVITLGLVPSVTAMLGIPYLRAALREQPRMLPQIIEAPGYALREMLEKGLVDVAVLPFSLVSKELQVLELYRDDLRIIVSPDRVVDTTLPRDLAALPWVVTRAPHSVRNALTVWFARHGLEPNVIAEVDSLPLVIEAVRANVGVAFLSSLSIPAYFNPASLQMLTLPDWTMDRIYFACWRRDAATGSVPLSVEILMRIGREIPGGERHP